MEPLNHTLPKLTVAVDVDEVLASFVEPLALFHNEKYNTSLKMEDFHSYHFSDVWGGTVKESIEKMNHFFHSEYFFDLPVIDGAWEVLNELNESNCFNFHIVTSRTSDLTEKTSKWIDNHFPNIFGKLLFGNAYGKSGQRGKGEMCHEIGATVLIDDNPKYLDQALQLGINAILFDLNGNYRWSKGHHLPSKLITAQSWTKIKDHLFELYHSAAFHQ